MEEILIEEINEWGIVGKDGALTPWESIRAVGKKETHSANDYTAGVMFDVLGHETVRFYAEDGQPDHLSVASIRARKIKGVVDEIPVQFCMIAEKLLREARRHPHIRFEHVNAQGGVEPLNIGKELQTLAFLRSPAVKAGIRHELKREGIKAAVTAVLCGIVLGIFFWLARTYLR
ncbi:MAG TPA: hypothetical protein VL688_11470 [Verrucomicrobiae bacterium]|jgi:hypothetical protein|nr:hypothetical protein [Verrucomicrobiae bacterium]